MKMLWVAAGTIVLIVAGAALIGTVREEKGTTERIALGRDLYVANCANCHGINLEGQPNWRSPRSDGRLPAPPHDETGHTWHHSDEQLLGIIRRGTAAIVGGNYQSDMPGFAEMLPDAESKAVLDYIKSTWPTREANYQRKISR